MECVHCARCAQERGENEATKEARAARGGAIKARREQLSNTISGSGGRSHLHAGAPRTHLNSARLHCFSNPSEPNDFCTRPTGSESRTAAERPQQAEAVGARPAAVIDGTRHRSNSMMICSATIGLIRDYYDYHDDQCIY